MTNDSNPIVSLSDALQALYNAVCGETGFANAVRHDSGHAYPWPALDDAEALAAVALRTPSRPAEGEVEPVAWPDTCDGVEQYAFEAWAKACGYDMHEHPLHYIFLDPKTDAARMGWKAGLLHAVERMKAAPTPPAPVSAASLTDGGALFEIADKTGKEPCGECHLQPGETCDICNAHEPASPTRPISPAHGVKELSTTPEMRARIRELSTADGSDDYDRAVRHLLDDVETLLAGQAHIVQRYTPETYSGRYVGMTAHPKGEWVNFRDILTTPADSGSVEVTEEMVERAAKAAHWANYEDPEQAEHEWHHWPGSADYARKIARVALTAALKNGRS